MSSEILVSSQALVEDEQNYHFLLPMQPGHKTALPALEVPLL
jgi:hypothetical protein